MKKYTIEEFKQGKKAVWIENMVQWYKLNEVHKLCGPYKLPDHYCNDLSWNGSKDYLESIHGYTCLDFSQLVFEEEFPEKYCIRGSDEFQRWNLEHPPKTDIDGGYRNRFYYPMNKDFTDWDFENFIREGYTEITLEQFKQYVLKQPKMEKEIIGYRAPCDLFGDYIKKGDIYIKKSSGQNGFYPQKNLEILTYYLPDELVKTWEPVYKEDKKLPVINGKGGSYKKGEKVVVYGNNCAMIHIDMLEAIYKARITNIGNRRMRSITLDSGVSITMEQIGEILEYVKFINKE